MGANIRQIIIIIYLALEFSVSTTKNQISHALILISICIFHYILLDSLYFSICCFFFPTNNSVSESVGVDLDGGTYSVESTELIFFVKLSIIEEDGLEFLEAEHTITCSVMLYDHVMNVLSRYLST